MKNANMPAMPLPNGADDRPYMFGHNEPIRDGHAVGLTKREQLAAMAMQGLCAHSGDYHTEQDLAHDAVMYADALLAELEKPNDN